MIQHWSLSGQFLWDWQSYFSSNVAKITIPVFSRFNFAKHASILHPSYLVAFCISAWPVQMLRCITEYNIIELIPWHNSDKNKSKRTIIGVEFQALFMRLPRVVCIWRQRFGRRIRSNGIFTIPWDKGYSISHICCDTLHKSGGGMTPHHVVVNWSDAHIRSLNSPRGSHFEE